MLWRQRRRGPAVGPAGKNQHRRTAAADADLGGGFRVPAGQLSQCAFRPLHGKMGIQVHLFITHRNSLLYVMYIVYRFKASERQIGIWCIVRTCHCEPARTLVWQSPSNSGQPIVIQTVLSCCFSKFIHEKLCFYPGDCHTSDVGHWFAMTGNSTNSNFPP